MLIKYRFNSVLQEGGKVYAVIDRLADLAFFERLRTPTQKAWDEKRFSEEDCLSTIENAKRQTTKEFKSTSVIEQMQIAISEIRRYKAQHGIT